MVNFSLLWTESLSNMLTYKLKTPLLSWPSSNLKSNPRPLLDLGKGKLIEKTKMLTKYPNILK